MTSLRNLAASSLRIADSTNIPRPSDTTPGARAAPSTYCSPAETNFAGALEPGLRVVSWMTVIDRSPVCR